MTLAALIASLLELAPGDVGYQRRVERTAPVVFEHARAAGLDPHLVALVIYRESAFRPGAVGARGEIGLGQLNLRGRPGELCRDLLPRLHRPHENIRCTVRVLADGLQRCGSWPRALTYYGAGSCGTSRYARRVLELVRP